MTLEEAKELFPEVSKKPPEKAYGYIYVTFEPISGKFYIGKKSKPKWLKSYFGSGVHPKQWQKDKLPLAHWPIQWCYSYEELNQAEYDWIDNFKTNDDIVNIFVGGGDRYTRVNKPISKEYGERISRRMKQYYKEHEHPMQGRHHTEEVKRRIGEYNKEYYKTHVNPSWFKVYTKEEREKQSIIRADIARKERVEYIPNTTKLAGCAKARVKVQCIETGEVFNSIKDAGHAYGTNSPFHISDVCRGKRRTALGYHWRYYDEEVTNEQHN